MTYYTHIFRTPVGDLYTAVNERGAVVRLLFAKEGRMAALESGLEGTIVRDAARCRHVVDQIEEYFSGERRAFDLEVDLDGTEFQKSVWKRLLEIPFGQTRSYRQLAERLGKPAATRAVGRANATNPVSIVVPCHRIIGADGSLTGFGGGIDVKRFLLELEGSLTRGLFPPGRKTGRARTAGRSARPAQSHRPPARRVSAE